MPMSSTSLRAKPIEVPEPDLTPKEIIARAATLREHLRDDQEATEQRTYYSARTHELFGQAGLYRILQPRRFGGYEFDIETFYRVVMELTRGCPSTGWCFCLGAAHVLQVAALFPEEGQQEIFAANDGHFVAASRDLPAGTVTPSGDGYVVNGTWNYCSGAPYSTHFIARALLANADGHTSEDSPNVLVAIPRADWTMLDDWHGLLGLRGSGSHSIQVKHATVPAHFVVDSDPFSFDTSNAALRSPVHPNPMYNSRHLNFFHGEIGAIMTGMADAATDEFERIIRTSKTSSPLPPGLRMDAPDHQRTLGLGLAKASAARQIVLGTARQHLEHCRQAAEDGIPYEAEQDLLLESTHGQAGELAFAAIENLARMSGSSNAVRDGRRMQRYLRDALVYRSHQQGASIDMMATQLAVARLHAKR
jgi:3-hydroxy-9,10-secoandrosta-1,3,5(10)-triene-9,17-dione monooxygenase